MSGAARCTWCGQPAYGVVTASGLAAPLYDCDSGDCWTRSYREVCDKTPRTWKLINRPGRKRTAQSAPSLFDQT